MVPTQRNEKEKKKEILYFSGSEDLVVLQPVVKPLLASWGQDSICGLDLRYFSRLGLLRIHFSDV